MKQLLKKSLSVILAITIIFSSAYVGLSEVDLDELFAVKAKAANGTCGGDLFWFLDNGTLTITGKGKMKNYFDYYDIPWYWSRSSIDSVVISNGVTSIGAYAFYNCESLTTITIPDSVTSIGADAFYNCESLRSITIPDSVTSIGAYAFYNCESLTSITIPDSVTSIGIGAFLSCGKLEKINWNAASIADFTISSDFDGVFAGAGINGDGIELVFGDGVKKIPAYLCFAGYGNSSPQIKKVTIPDSVTSIGDCAFYDCKRLTSIAIPDSVTRICENTFYNCESLTSIIISDSVTSIGEGAFDGCTSLAEVTIGNSVTIIGNYAFDNCNNLNYVFFKGTETNWNNISIGASNEELTCSYIHYKSVGHFYSSQWTIDTQPTCDSFGSKSHHCTRCDAKTDITRINPLEHEFKGWKTVTKPTATSMGQQKNECSGCDYVDFRVICATPKLKSVTNTASGVKFTWSKVKGAKTYAVYRKTGSGKWVQIAKGIKSTSYTDKKAKSGTTYKYSVRAATEFNVYSSYNTTGLKIKHLADPTLKTPSSIKKGIVLKWNKISGAQGYQVYRKTGSGSYSKIATVKGSTKVTYTDKSAKKGKKYSYKVKAYYSKTYSAYSNTKKIKDKY